MPRPAKTDFAPLALSGDDQLPADIELVMGYRYPIPPDCCAAALEQGLRAFPHLTGMRIGMASIVPSEDRFALETVESPASTDVRDLEAMPITEQSSAYVPKGRDPSSPGSLFQARLTRIAKTGLSVLGLRVSHAAVDGTGLALFICHCTAAARGVVPPPVFHERGHGIGTCLDGPDDPPDGYREGGGPTEEDALASSAPSVFAIPAESVKSFFCATTILDARLKLGAWLCASVRSRFTEVALWCDPRGTNGIPATYTGNSGCYLHLPLLGTTADELTKRLKAMATRAGFQRIADTHRRIKLAEARGRPLVWVGAGAGVLQLNLVPYAVAGTDFGGGLPAYAILLSRNASGLRISLTPDASRFLIEACLPDGMGDGLVDNCRAAGLEPALWCRGEVTPQAPRK